MGVLALQGAFAAHAKVIASLGLAVRDVRGVGDLRALAGLVLPGGESTTQLELLRRDPALREAIDAFVRSGAPVLATCAGLVLAAREVVPAQECFGWLDVTVRRNGFGRQRHSAEAIADDGAPLVLIRAPRIERVGPSVTVEATLHGEPVLVRRAEMWGATYHPELTGDASLHARVFASLLGPAARRAAASR